MTLFEVWAPAAQERVTLHVDGRELPMTAEPGGWWRLEVAEAGHGSRYAFAVDRDDPRPDPRSRWQPDGVHAASAVVEQDRFEWTDAGWRGVAPNDVVAYELHVGTFTPEGTFDAAISRFDHLVALGISLIELLPVNAFDGERGWGYDGVGLWAVQESYGGPAGLTRFVDAAHSRGLGVCVDAVYNHLGPSGNYLSTFGPYFTDTHMTPWGPAVNLDAPGSDEVRAFIIGSALRWLRDFHVDVLRLDAVHALVDTRALPLLEELASAVDSLAESADRSIWLVAESDLNDPRTTAPRAEGSGYGGHGVHAQWDDDIHHSLFALLTGDADGYYAEFAADAPAAYAKVTGRAFFHDGTYSAFRGRVHGRPIDPRRVAGHRFWGFLNNHDQIGNRAVGDRMSSSVSEGVLAAGAALLLTGPFTPMLFMGEEWGARTPWQFFTSFPDAELGHAVSAGRRAEFGSHGWKLDDVPDPQALTTFTASKLDWSEAAEAEHQPLLDFYRALIAVRRAEPVLRDGNLAAVRVHSGGDGDRTWVTQQRGDVLTIAVLGAAGATIELPTPGPAVLARFGEVAITGATAVFSSPGAAVLRLTDGA